MKKKKKEIKKIQDTTPASLIQSAIAGGADLDELGKLLDLQLKWEANEAKKAYVIAMSAFQADPPKIEKDSHVEFKTTTGTVKYNHASLANVTEKINKALSQHGLSAGWKTDQDDTRIIVTCKITHIMGHSEETTLKSASDMTGGKNAIQAIGSAISYLQRYTLLSLTGLATFDMDDDGKSTEPPKEGKSPTKKQIKKDDSASASIAQTTVIIQNMIGSHLMNNFEKYRLARQLFHGLTKFNAIQIIGWWVGDTKKKIKSERAKRAEIEKGDESGEAINNHLNQIYSADCKKYSDDLKQYNHYCSLPAKESPFNILDPKILMKKYLEYRKMTEEIKEGA